MAANTIGRVAATADVGVETVRFYERQGLITQPPTPHRGYREYPADTSDRIRFVRHASELGFTLAEVRDLLSLRVHPRRSCGAVKERAEDKLQDVEGKIRALKRIEKELRRLTTACEDRIPTGECPILQALQ